MQTVTSTSKPHANIVVRFCNILNWLPVLQTRNPWRIWWTSSELKNNEKKKKDSLKCTTYVNTIATQFIQVLINAKQSESFMNYVFQKNRVLFSGMSQG